MDDKVFIFSKEEFIVLAAASGIRTMYGFSFSEEMEDRRVVQILHKLAGRGLLLSTEGSFRLQ